MLNFHLSYQYLRWRRPQGPPPALPEGIERLWVKTAQGPLELLYAAPKDIETSRIKKASPLFFLHGGMGSAWVWLEWMQYISARGVPCYALSTRGHGESWHPSYLRMVFATTKRALADDVVAGIRLVQDREGQEVVLVGHSSGGGLSQFILSEQEIRVKALALCGAVPGFGS